MDTNRRVRVGQRVWVTYDGGRAFGQVAAIPSPFLSDSTGFVVLLDRKPTPVICTRERRGSQWDFADLRGVWFSQR
jgi:hypothetical protein